MNKSIAWAAIILAALFAVLIWKGFLQLPGKTTAVSIAVPGNAIAVFQFNDINKTFSEIDKAAYANDLAYFEWYEEMQAGASLIEYLAGKETDVLLPGKMISSIHHLNKENLGVLHIIPGEKYGVKPFKLFRKAFVSEKDKIQTTTYKGVTIYEAQTSLKDFKVLSFAECEGLILFSRSTRLLEKSISSIHRGANNKSLQIANNKLNSKTLKFGFHTNFKNYDAVNSIVHKEDNNNIFNWLYRHANNLNGEIYINKNRLVLNGLLDYKPSLYLKQLMANSAGSNFTLKPYIPESVSGFKWFSVNNFYTFVESCIEQEDFKNSDALLNLSEGLGSEWLISWHNNAATEISFTFDVADIEKAGSAIDSSFDKKESTKIKPFKDLTLLEFVAETNDFNKVENAYYTFNAGKLIIANEKSLLEKITSSLKTGKTIDKTEAFINFESNLMPDNSVLFYIKTNKLNTWLSNEFSNLSNAKRTALSNFYPAILQVYPLNGQLYINATFAYKGKGLTEKINLEAAPAPFKNIFAKKKATNKWQKLLGLNVISGPHQFVNHYTGLKEYIVQDENNNLLLVNNSDSILWRKKLNGNILGGINQVDYYNNKKFQILLNTPQSIYLIDRTGKDVSTFPVALPTKATNPMTIVTYKDVNKVRYFIAADNGKLYGFNKDGSPLKGWNVKEKIGRVTLPLQHIVSDKKDYLTIINEEAELFLFARNGKLRSEQSIKLNAKNIQSFRSIDSSKGEKLLEIKHGKNQILTINLTGEIIN